MILDCESRDSTLNSVSAIYGVSKEKIEQFLRETNLQKHYALTDPQHAGDKELTLLFERAFSRTPFPILRVFWFHLTRAKAGINFVDGIQPLGKALDNVWTTILAVFDNTRHGNQLRVLKEKGVPGSQYCLKVSQPFLGGPYAMLVRESAFRWCEMGNHDYLWLPEIMEDICNGYHEEYGEMVHDTLSHSLVPYIIKFWSKKKTNKSCLESAMYYLYITAQGQPLTIHANTCFDGENVRIPPEQIVKIESCKGGYDDGEKLRQ